MQLPYFQRWELPRPGPRIHFAARRMVLRLVGNRDMRPHEENAPPVRCLADVERRPDHSSKVARDPRHFADERRFYVPPEPTLPACLLNRESRYTRGFHARLNWHRFVRELNSQSNHT